MVASGAALWPLINQMNPSADVRALATISVDISGLAEDTQLTVNWRGKPVFIRHRTQAEMAQAREEAVSALPDTDARNPNLPDEAIALDENRASPGHDAYMVMIGVCMHLECVLLGDRAGDFGGWFYPCHGSHYDTAGRIGKGPAPENLHIPPLSLSEDLVLTLG